VTPRKSSKRSGGSYAKKRRSPRPTFFLDATIPSMHVFQALGEVGLKVEQLNCHLDEDAEDPEWLQFVGEHRNWVAIGRDKNIVHRPSLRAAVERHRVGYFVLAYKRDVSAEEQAQILKESKEWMLRVTATYQKPFIARIGQNKRDVWRGKKKAPPRRKK